MFDGKSTVFLQNKQIKAVKNRPAVTVLELIGREQQSDVSTSHNVNILPPHLQDRRFPTIRELDSQGLGMRFPTSGNRIPDRSGTYQPDRCCFFSVLVLSYHRFMLSL